YQVDETFVAWVQPLAAPDNLQSQQRQSSSIERWERQDVDDGKIQTKECGQVEQREPSKLWDEAGCLAGEMDDARGSSNLMDVEGSVEDVADEFNKATQHDASLLH